MSFDLVSNLDDSKFSFSGTGWSFCLILAEKFGWVPLGTQKPNEYRDFEKWYGAYDANEGQIVLSEDALNLASCLKKALDSNELQNSANDVAIAIENAIIEAIGDVPPDLKVDARVDEEFRSYYAGFIEFCNRGEFTIL